MILEGKNDLIGYIHRNPQLKQRYDQVTFSNELLDIFKKNFSEGGEIKVISASWCKDCVELVPKFGKISEYLPEWTVTMVSRDTLSYEDRIKYNIQHIPTFIFYNKKDREIGRIVEQPVGNSLEEDMANFASD
jgi:thiol-disulfide isomerase/thioredoxin